MRSRPDKQQRQAEQIAKLLLEGNQKAALEKAAELLKQKEARANNYLQMKSNRG